ncbi:hypothetical protein AVEN_261926-1 [Araneus ventricosus]|uniref:Uncharacterized protein n=1 Tax=Araneus ventricosus TaxID=182803 RepID=A0A4Y2MX46_ARAVE|nr:hypothetical protein AVEN_261926-1 [Araneus ventricosus]
MFTLPTLLYLKLFCPCSGNACIILLYPINPVLHMLMERLSPHWSSTGLPPFLGRPGQCGYFCTAPAEGCFIWCAVVPIHGGTSVESVLEPAALRYRGGDLTTRPLRPRDTHRKGR